jgi:hypothetical protein
VYLIASNRRDPYDLVPIIEKPKHDKKLMFEKEMQRGERNHVKELKTTQDEIAFQINKQKNKTDKDLPVSITPN